MRTVLSVGATRATSFKSRCMRALAPTIGGSGSSPVAAGAAVRRDPPGRPPAGVTAPVGLNGWRGTRVSQPG